MERVVDQLDVLALIGLFWCGCGQTCVISLASVSGSTAVVSRDSCMDSLVSFFWRCASSYSFHLLLEPQASANTKIGRNNRSLQTTCTAEEGFTVISKVGAV